MQPISPSSLHNQIDTKKKKKSIKICPSVNGYKLHLSKLCDSAFYKTRRGLFHGSVVKNLPASEGDMGLIPGPGRSHTPQGN